MKEKIIQLENLLSNLKEEISRQAYIETIDPKVLHETMQELQTKGFSKDQTDGFMKNVTMRKSEEILKLFYEVNIPEIKSLLSAALRNIEHVEKNRTENSNSSINFSHPNRDFKNLIEKHLLTSQQEIFGTFKKQTFVGHLTEDGFFELNIEGKKVICPDFKYATFRAWNKVIPNDGWYVWSAVDNKTGKIKSLNHFRNQLKKIV